jgi:hypothetical protein
MRTYLLHVKQSTRNTSDQVQVTFYEQSVMLNPCPTIPVHLRLRNNAVTCTLHHHTSLPLCYRGCHQQARKKLAGRSRRNAQLTHLRHHNHESRMGAAPRIEPLTCKLHPATSRGRQPCFPL